MDHCLILWLVTIARRLRASVSNAFSDADGASKTSWIVIFCP